MRTIVAGLVAVLASNMAWAGDDPYRRGPTESRSVELPSDWRAHSDVEARVTYADFSRGRPGGSSADGTGLAVAGRFGVDGGFYLLVDVDYYWLEDQESRAVEFGYIRAAVGYRARPVPALELGAELGGQGQIGKDFFGKRKVTEDAEFGRVWLRDRLMEGVIVSASATLGSDYRAVELRADKRLTPGRLYLGLSAAAGRAESADFWSVGPSLRWAFGH